MKALIQRVSRGCVSVEGKATAEIGAGYVVLVGVRQGDTEDDARYLAHKTIGLRIFADRDGRMNLSVADTGGAILAISQFTLCADTRRGNRPSFIEAAPPEVAEPLYRLYVESLARSLGADRVRTGVFGARMSVELVNDGPVTVELDSARR